MNTLNTIKLKTNFTSSENIIKEYLINHPKEAVNLNQKELETKIYVSGSTIYRFCTKMGFKKYDDLRLALSLDLLSLQNDEIPLNFSFPFTKSDTMDLVSQHLLALCQESLTETFNNLDYNELSSAIYYLHRADTICYLTTNTNTTMAEMFQVKMLEIGKNVHIAASPYEWHKEIVNLKENDVIMMNSYGGNSSKPILESISISDKKKIKFILIASTHNQTMIPFADTVLLMCDKEKPSHESAGFSFSSEISIYYLHMLLYAGVYQKDFDKNNEKRKRLYNK